MTESLKPRERLLVLQRRLCERINDDINAYLGPQAKQLRAYQRIYENDLQHIDGPSNKEQLINAVRQSNLVYCGDYHTLHQAQKTVIKILREVIPHRREIFLCLEMLHHSDQAAVDKYMAGQISENQFLLQIDYQQRWNFEWRHYKQLFDFARRYSIKIVGLNYDAGRSKHPLYERDQNAAKIISSIYRVYPGALLFVLYGDHHIAKKHIPHLTQTLLSQDEWIHCKQTIIYQNSESIYWRLADHGLERKVDVVRLEGGDFCVLNTPPWIKLQSYLNWLEESASPTDPAAPHLRDSANQGDGYDYFFQMLDIGETIATFLSLDQDFTEPFEVMSRGAIEFLDELSDTQKALAPLAKFDAELLQTELIYNGTALLLDKNVIYLATSSINRAAEKMAQLIHFRITGSQLLLTNDSDRFEHYFGRILIEAIGYLGSKIINYKRKCSLVPDLKRNLETYGRKHLHGRIREQRQISRLAVQHFDLEKDFLNSQQRDRRKWRELLQQPPAVYFGVTQTVGRILGERLFEAVIEDQIFKDVVREIFQTPILADSANHQTVLALSRALNQTRGAAGSKSDRF